MGTKWLWRPAVLALALILSSSFGFSAPDSFSQKPSYIDPALGGWVEPLRTLTFQVGCGEVYYVAAVFLGSHRDLHVFCRSKITLRRFDQQKLQRFAEKLAGVLAPAAADLAKKDHIEGVVMTFYSTFLQGNVLTLEVYDSCIAAKPSMAGGPLVLCHLETRTQAQSAP